MNDSPPLIALDDYTCLAGLRRPKRKGEWDQFKGWGGNAPIPICSAMEQMYGGMSVWSKITSRHIKKSLECC